MIPTTRNKAEKIGITGCIGSGKSTVSKIFQTYGIPVFDADFETKKLYQTNSILKEKMIVLFGKETYTSEGFLNKIYLSEIVFNSKEKLIALNELVHPFTKEASENWFAEQIHVPFALKEAALLLESGSHLLLDFIICVTAPEELRINRVMKRDTVTSDEVLKRMNNQWSQEEKMKHAHFIIENDEVKPLLIQVEKIYNELK